jgi:hypothetical protein
MSSFAPVDVDVDGTTTGVATAIVGTAGDDTLLLLLLLLIVDIIIKLIVDWCLLLIASKLTEELI